ncbi:MAG: DeoR family transcriptional regulator [Promethearchaeota archaeon]|nr:MAG: DeoR family transcriptional regulator [Candidatus Lokiarchaeota archaeon]
MLDLIHKKRANINKISEKFGVSKLTIRREPNTLSTEGVILKKS